ncbi:MAG: L-serine ammonia-lyase, iron-sulfur-dependent, subunit alpha [Oscillospiraceae bacterium]|nr:L-serine ammonia-lyase, iron-sulfur-dependent, subunit alpha [Oscillospiraceae bacterium]
MAIQSIASILDACAETGTPFWRVLLQEEAAEQNMLDTDVFDKMDMLWQAMLDAADSYEPSRKSVSSLVGGDAEKITAHHAAGESLCGDYTAAVMAHAIAMGESNACMKRIVAAPTAGACGVIPAVLIPLYRDGTPRKTIIESLFVSGGVGEVIAARASIAGASGGCQAEIGAASAMAAAALVHTRSGSAAQICDAAAMALSNLLGLVCDPVAGLVEIPCVKRNVIGAMNAVSCADMALAGITNAIPLDEVIDAMGEVGAAMPPQFRETAKGGLAATPTGQAICRRLTAHDGAAADPAHT